MTNLGLFLKIASENKKKFKTISLLLIVFCITLIYATVRYNVFKGVPWSSFPDYVANKALAWTSLVSICLSYLTGLLPGFGINVFGNLLPLRKYLGVYGFILAAVHIMLTLAILTAENYPSLFDGNTINEKGEYVILFGLLCLGGFLMPAMTSVKAVRESMSGEKWKRLQQLGYFALFANILHVMSMGYTGWPEPAQWPGFMPPITMIAAVISVITLVFKLFALFKYKN